VDAGAEPARPQRFGGRGRWVFWVGAIRLAGHDCSTDDGASTSPHGAALAGHSSLQARAGRGRAVPNAAEATIQRTRHGAGPRGRLVIPRWPELERAGGRVVVPRWPELARGRLRPARTGGAALPHLGLELERGSLRQQGGGSWPFPHRCRSRAGGRMGRRRPRRLSRRWSSGRRGGDGWRAEPELLRRGTPARTRGRGGPARCLVEGAATISVFTHGAGPRGKLAVPADLGARKGGREGCRPHGGLVLARGSLRSVAGRRLVIPRPVGLERGRLRQRPGGGGVVLPHRRRSLRGWREGGRPADSVDRGSGGGRPHGGWNSRAGDCVSADGGCGRPPPRTVGLARAGGWVAVLPPTDGT
jgi:hypothetical protein